MSKSKIPHWLLKERQGYSLEQKVELSQEKIREWYEHWGGMVYVAFSGGKDSTVLLHLVRGMYPGVPAVFSDTGLEYPEIKEFVRQFDNVIWIRPRKTFIQTIQQYGYPVVSKRISMGVSRYRNTKSEKQRQLRLYGGINPTSGRKQQPTVSKKWHFLIDAPFKISERCCDVLKKQPFGKYERETNRKPYIGTMASDSNIRLIQYARTGCNAFDAEKPKSKPMAFWLEQDVWEYIKTNDISYCQIYDTGEHNTGCIFCALGAHLEPEPNRFQRLKTSHPKLWKYCMDKLGMREVLDYINVPYE